MSRIFRCIRIGLDSRLLARNLEHNGSLGVERILLDVNLRPVLEVRPGDIRQAVTDFLDSPGGNHGYILAKGGGSPSR